jgi:hypothetical protein
MRSSEFLMDRGGDSRSDAGEAHNRILIACAMAMPTRALGALAPGSDSDVQQLLRISLAAFIRRNPGERYATVGEAWNAWIRGRTHVSVFPIRCPECKGKGFSLKSAARGTSVCRSCMGRRTVHVRQRVEAARAAGPVGAGWMSGLSGWDEE